MQCGYKYLLRSTVFVITNKEKKNVGPIYFRNRNKNTKKIVKPLIQFKISLLTVLSCYAIIITIALLLNFV